MRTPVVRAIYEAGYHSRGQFPTSLMPLTSNTPKVIHILSYMQSVVSQLRRGIKVLQEIRFAGSKLRLGTSVRSVKGPNTTLARRTFLSCGRALTFPRRGIEPHRPTVTKSFEAMAR